MINIRVGDSTHPCYNERSVNPIGKSSKYKFDKLNVGQSVFIKWESFEKLVPYEAGLARIAANGLNRKFKGRLELYVDYYRLSGNTWQMEIARIA